MNNATDSTTETQTDTLPSNVLEATKTLVQALVEQGLGQTFCLQDLVDCSDQRDYLFARADRITDLRTKIKVARTFEKQGLFAA